MILLLTYVDAVFAGFGTADARPIAHATPDVLRQMRFAAGSIGRKVEAARRFVTAKRGRAAIGALDEAYWWRGRSAHWWPATHDPPRSTTSGVGLSR